MKLGKSVKLESAPRCLSCNTLLDGATNTGETRRPESGDISICSYCGHLMAFDDNILLRELTSDEMYECAGDPLILQVQAACAAARKALQ